MPKLWNRVFGIIRGDRKPLKAELLQQISEMITVWEDVKATKFSDYGTILSEARNLPPHYIERRSAGYEAVTKILSLLQQVRNEASSLDERELERIATILDSSELKRLEESFETNFRYEVNSKPRPEYLQASRLNRRLSVEERLHDDR